MERVSVIITTYCRSVDIVERAICSVVNQTYPIYELALIDDNIDGASICTELKKMADRYDAVTYVKQNGNQGACAARNLGIKLTEGEYVAFLDDDDEWLPNKIEVQINSFHRSDTNVGLVSCAGYVKNATTQEESDYYNIDYCKDSISFDDMLVWDCVGSTSQPLIKRDCFNKVGVFWIDQPARQDYEMWIRISKEYVIKGIEDRLFIHYYHDGEQISKNQIKAYVGLNNIYRRYRNNFKTNKVAMRSLVNRMYHTIDWSYPFKKFKWGWLKFWYQL